MSITIGDFLQRIKRPIELDPNKEYKQVTIKLYHKGVVLRGLKKGSEIRSKVYEVKKGDFILSGIDARNGAFGIVPEELDGAVVTNDFWYFKVNEEIISKHLFLELTQTSWFDEICRLGSDGTTQRIRLQKDRFFTQEISLPKKDEQDTLLDKVLSSKNLTGNLSAEIDHQQDLLKKLRQQILQDAISGKLTEKWREENPDVEPASELLARIKAEKEKLVKEGKIKKQKPLPLIKDDEIPFDLPEGWCWCRLGEVSENYDGLRVPISKAERERRKKIYDYYGASGIIDKIDNYTHDGNFLLIGEDGANLVSRSTPIAFIARGKFWVNNHAHALGFLDENLLQYISTHINGISLIPYVTGGFQPKLSQNNLNLILIALPPVKEIAIINKKVQETYLISSELEEQITYSVEKNGLLMQAVLKEAFSR